MTYGPRLRGPYVYVLSGQGIPLCRYTAEIATFISWRREHAREGLFITNRGT